jgi:ornithine cyclodeaminase/alanine dehydrogenase-like protein (mu-crystallin family)
VSVLIIRDADVRAVIDARAAIAPVSAGVVEAGRSGAAPARARADLPAEGWLRMMAGVLPESDVFGFKAFHLVPGGAIRYLCALYRLSTGAPLALIDADRLTALRTSATAAAAAHAFWGAAPIRVGVVGSGLLARGGLRALAATCDVTAVRAFSPRERSRRAFAETLGEELGVSVEPVTSVGAAAAEADMLLCATHTRGDVAVRATELGDVRYVSSISSTLPAQREVDADVFGAVERMVIDTSDVMSDSGDVLAARAAGTLERLEVVELWRQLAAPEGRGRGGPRTLYKSIGSVEQDLALAAHVHARCVEEGLGQAIDPVELGRVVDSGA